MYSDVESLESVGVESEVRISIVSVTCMMSRVYERDALRFAFLDNFPRSSHRDLSVHLKGYTNVWRRWQYIGHCRALPTHFRKSK